MRFGGGGKLVGVGDGGSGSDEGTLGKHEGRELRYSCIT